MTGDEMERAIDALRESMTDLVIYVGQVDRNLGARIEEVNTNLGARIEEVNANLGARIEETNAQVAETNRQLAETNKLLRLQGDTQSTFIEVMTSSFNDLAAAQARLAAAQARTDERLNALISVVERHISEGGHGQAP